LTNSTFSELGLAEPLLRALSAVHYTVPTPIQLRAIPPLLAGRDTLGIAQTGTGKTAAFALPMLQRLAASGARARPGAPLVLILAPTRELAIQICESIKDYGRNYGFKTALIFGGVGERPQIEAMRRGADIVVATPGRLLDLLNRRHLRLDAVNYFVLDEADRMLDMGFIRDVRKIVAMLPKQRQSLLFSATMPGDIARLAAELLRDPVRVEVAPAATTVERVEQRVHFVEPADKRGLLLKLLADRALARVIVFTRTKHGANKVARIIAAAGIRADAIHGNKSQNARQRALEDFRAGRVRVLVATDIAARGIDVDGITHVINYELPNIAESYVHRIGRTARAGAAGVAVSLCSREERAYLKDIEKLTRQTIAVAGHAPAAPARKAPHPAPRREAPAKAKDQGGWAPRFLTGGDARPGAARRAA
jgi:ATP-dependent RNA helicase RhlE